MQETKWTYFQYFKQFDFPVFVRADITQFTPELAKFFAGLQFKQLEESEAEKVQETLSKTPHARLLSLAEASVKVSRQIDSVLESDRFGVESVVPKQGYTVYRYKGTALVVYSLAAQNWEMGCYYDFGTEKSAIASKAIITRYLSWALAPLGVIGFWGVPVDEGAVVMRQHESQGEAVFFDVRKRIFLSIEGDKRLSARFKLLKLDPTLKNRNINMGREETMSFLSSHCTYFDFEGLSIPARQLIQALSGQVQALVHPKESFKPRTDLSLS